MFVSIKIQIRPTHCNWLKTLKSLLGHSKVFNLSARRAAQLMMGLYPDKHIISWKYLVKNTLIHLTYRTSLLSPAHLTRSQNTYIRLQLGRIISHNEYNREYWLFTLVIAWLAGNCGSLPLSSIISIMSHIANPGKDQNPKLQIRILLNVYSSPCTPL